MPSSYPILEFDEGREAIIEPSKAIKHRDVAEHCVICFFRETIEHVTEELSLQPLRPIRTGMGDIPVYSGVYQGISLAILSAPVGAALAAGCLEEIIARGGRKFVACGGAGVLDHSIESGAIIVPTSALRDEGTSYHYLPPSREVSPTADAVAAIREILKESGCRYIEGKTWSTDGFYRETKERVARRRKEGCIAVEMEAAAFFAVAQFRNVQLAQLLYGVDDVSGAEWEPRIMGEKVPARDALFWLALKACLRL